MPTAAGCSPSGDSSAGRSSTTRSIFLEAPAVPIVVAAIDEYGIVRTVRRRNVQSRVPRQDVRGRSTGGCSVRGLPIAACSLRRKAEAKPDPGAWRALGDALTIWGPAERLDEAIEAYSRTLTDPEDKNARFRLGIPHRMRHESAGRRPGDFQAAVDAWSRALALDPNQYIWRRRIEQYGPRLTKPYAFYDWIVQAREEITRRGETPVPLAVEPYGSELAGPVRDILADAAAPVEPDPKGQIQRNAHRLIEAEVVVVPSRVRPGEAAGASHLWPRAQQLPRTGTTNPHRCESGSEGPKAEQPRPECSRHRSRLGPSRLRSAVSTSRSRHPRPAPETPASRSTLCTTPANRQEASASSSARI